MAGHADQRPALPGEPPRLGARGEARSLDDDHRAAVRRTSGAAAGQRLGDTRAVGVGERDVHRAVLDVASARGRWSGRRAGRAPRRRPVPPRAGARRQRTGRAPGARRASAAPRGWPGRGPGAAGSRGRRRAGARTRPAARPTVPTRAGADGAPYGVSTATLLGVVEERVEAGAADHGDVGDAFLQPGAHDHTLPDVTAAGHEQVTSTSGAARQRRRIGRRVGRLRQPQYVDARWRPSGRHRAFRNRRVQFSARLPPQQQGPHHASLQIRARTPTTRTQCLKHAPGGICFQAFHR